MRTNMHISENRLQSICKTCSMQPRSFIFSFPGSASGNGNDVIIFLEYCNLLNKGWPVFTLQNTLRDFI